jgi:hypothetical protein
VETTGGLAFEQSPLNEPHLVASADRR